jgi:hypothetical protein
VRLDLPMTPHRARLVNFGGDKAIASRLPMSSRVVAGPWAAKSPEPSSGFLVTAIPRAPGPADLTNGQFRPTSKKVGPVSAQPIPPADGVTDPPVTDTEQVLAVIWSEVLQVPHVGVEQNFFDLRGREPS